MRTLTRTKGVEVVSGQEAGWSGGRGFARGQRSRVTSPVKVYGGTDESVGWVYSCVTMRAQALAGYAWWTYVQGSEKQPIARPGRGESKEFYALMDEPNDEMTYFDFIENISTDLDLCGNSFWLLDMQNGLGQPETLERLLPGTCKVATNDKGKRIGYVYEPKQGGPKITYSLSEIMHIRYPNPLNRYYGMGVVEALVRAVDSELSQQAHVTAFFNQGAHFSGVLTLPETIGEEEFQRLQRQYQEEFAGSESSFRVLIAESAQSYTPISTGPRNLGIIDLRRLQKDEILSGFGVPEFLLGGTGQGGVYKMDEAQNVFYRAMIPLGRRVGGRITLDVASRFSLSSSNASTRKPLGFHIDPRQSDTQTSKVERARQLVGTGATMDDIREEAGKERLEWKGVTDVPMVPSGLVLYGQDGPVHDSGPAPPAPPAIATDPNNKPGGDANAEDKPPGTQPAPEPKKSVKELNSGDVVEDIDEDKIEATIPEVPTIEEPTATVPLIPELPSAGAPEQVVAPGGQPSDDLLPSLRAHLIGQRTRALDSLGQYGAADGSRLRSKPTKARSALTADCLLSPDDEDANLRNLLINAGYDSGVKETCEIINACVEQVREVVAVGIKRGYGVAQIANGFPLERYRGIAGVYDDALINDNLHVEARSYLSRQQPSRREDA